MKKKANTDHNKERHYCYVCGKKRYEYLMKSVGTRKNDKPAWICISHGDQEGARPDLGDPSFLYSKFSHSMDKNFTTERIIKDYTKLVHQCIDTINNSNGMWWMLPYWCRCILMACRYLEEHGHPSIMIPEGYTTAINKYGNMTSEEVSEWKKQNER